MAAAVGQVHRENQSFLGTWWCLDGYFRVVMYSLGWRSTSQSARKEVSPDVGGLHRDSVADEEGHRHLNNSASVV